MIKSREEQANDFREMCEVAERINGKLCDKCLGTGTRGWHIELEQYLPCQCVTNAAMKATAAKIKEAKEQKESVN